MIIAFFELVDANREPTMETKLTSLINGHTKTFKKMQ
jgi:hypothetical protein